MIATTQETSGEARPPLEAGPARRRTSYVSMGGETPLIGAPIYEFLAEVASRHGDEEAIVSRHQGSRLTYRAFFREVDRLARGLAAIGARRGTRVGIWATNNVEWILLQIATARIGAVLVNINPAYRSAELEHALTAARVEALFLMPSFKTSHYARMVRKLCPEVETSVPDELCCARLPELRRLVVFDPEEVAATPRPAPGFLTWPEVLERGERIMSDGARPELDPDDPINIQFTSGTTGFAKPVVLTHHGLLNNAYSVAEVMGLSARDRLCVPVPFYHCFGMVLSNLACLSRGATLVIPAPHFDPAATLAAVEAERCTALHGVPTMFVAELALDGFERYDLSSLRTGIMAGAPCPPELMRQVIRDMGCRGILIGYGQTEASPVTHVTRPSDSFERRVGTVGTNLPHQEAKVVDPATGAIVPVGTAGELCFRGYHVMRGYFGDEAATREAIDEAGWLHSGDLGVIDEDGYARITGRLKEMIIRGGENIYPAEIEAHLATHPEVVQAAVFGIADQKWGEELGAWVQLREGATLEAAELRAWTRDNLAHYKVPRYLRVVDRFPLTVTGKIQKFRIREQVERELATTKAGVSGTRVA